MNYGKRKNGGDHGSVMTNKDVVDFMLDVSEYSEEKNLFGISILEPGAGHGAFLIPILERLFSSSQKYKFSFEEALQYIVSVELDTVKINSLREKVSDFLLSKNIRNTKERSFSIVREGNFLTTNFQNVDVVIGNPPYVRHEQIPENEKQKYRELFSSFKNRSDLYIAFYEKSLSLLKENGRVCFICADRWMKNKYGEHLRGLIEKSFHVSLIVDVDGAKVFDEEVDAYPAITLIENAKKNGYIREKIECISYLSVIKNSFLREEKTWENFSFSPQKRDDFSFLEEQEFKIGIGVASGADKIFIKEDFGEVEKDLILPLVRSRDISNGKIQKVKYKVLNPYQESTGSLINLSLYPQAQKYLEASKETLQKRYVAKKNPSHWYKTIDRIYPSLTKRPKILLPDIKKNSESVVLDTGKYYPHHNVYYITHKKDDISQLEILGAFLLSDFVQEQMKEISVIMRGGFFRWQAQNLRKVKIPKIEDIPEREKEKLQEAFQKRDFEVLNKIINKITSISIPKRNPKTFLRREKSQIQKPQKEIVFI